MTLRNTAYRRITAASHRSYNGTLRSRSALVTTDTELIDIAAPANMGDNNSPKNG
jgi:hypothetical protein